MTEGIVTAGTGSSSGCSSRSSCGSRSGSTSSPTRASPSPLADWNEKVDDKWNQFAAVEPGGMKIPLEHHDAPGRRLRPRGRGPQEHEPRARRTVERGPRRRRQLLPADEGQHGPPRVRAPHRPAGRVPADRQGLPRRSWARPRSGPRTTRAGPSRRSPRSSTDALYLDDKDARAPAVTAIARPGRAHRRRRAAAGRVRAGRQARLRREVRGLDLQEPRRGDARQAARRQEVDHPDGVLVRQPAASWATPAASRAPKRTTTPWSPATSATSWTSSAAPIPKKEWTVGPKSEPGPAAPGCPTPRPRPRGARGRATTGR